MKQYFGWSFLKSAGKWLVVGTLIRMLIVAAVSLIVGFGFISPADSAPLFPQGLEIVNGEVEAEDKIVESNREAEVYDCIMLAGLDCAVCIPICLFDVTGGAACVSCLAICAASPI